MCVSTILKDLLLDVHVIPLNSSSGIYECVSFFVGEL